MKGFKNTTRTQYFTGGDVGGYAKGGMAKAAKPATAKAKAPMKKNEGGKIGKMPPLGESVKSGNRMSKMTAAEMRAMEARFGEKKRPSPADSAKSGNRMSAQEGAEARKMKMAVGGKVSAPNKMSVDYGPVKRPAPPPTLERKPKIELSASGKARLEAQKAAKVEAQEAAMRRAPGRAVPAKGMPQPEIVVTGTRRPVLNDTPVYYDPPPPMQRPGMDRVDPGFAIDRGGYDMTAPPMPPPLMRDSGPMPAVPYSQRQPQMQQTDPMRQAIQSGIRNGQFSPRALSRADMLGRLSEMTTVNSGAPTPQAPAAMPGAPQTDPRFRMGGMVKRRPC